MNSAKGDLTPARKGAVWRYALCTGAVIIAIAFGGAAWLYAGLYNVAADDPHWLLTERFLETFRQRSIERESRRISVPALDSRDLIAEGARQYEEMCVDCHLSPGMAETATYQGLYPKPPKLAASRVEPRAAFWVLKHGIKMTAMPAWGATHDDATLWSIVAFLGALPRLSADEYNALVHPAQPQTDERVAKPSHQHRGHVHRKPHTH